MATKFTDHPSVAFPNMVLGRQFEAVSDLNYALAKAIRRHATLAVEADGDPVGGGFRSGDLAFLEAGDEGVAELKTMLENAARGYIANALPHLYDGTERLRGRTRIESWARILRARQAIAAHIHDGALFTGTYYVAVPKSILETETVDGDLVLAHPSGEAIAANAPLPLRTEMHIQINEGLLFLHPAFLPHRVPRFEGGGERLSVSFAVQPMGGA
jgi:uncharacterized protein (TIGR02466 family)